MLKTSINRENVLYSIIALTLCIITAHVIVYAPEKVLVAFFLLPIIIIIFLNSPHLTKILFPIILITFPVTLQFAGYDAFSTGTLSIFAVLAWSLTKFRINMTIVNNTFIFKILLLIALIAFIGMITKTPQGFWGPAVRHYVHLISSIAIFILIIHSQNIRGIASNKQEYIEKIIGALLIITTIHIFLSLIIFNYPSIEQYFDVFLLRTQEHLGGHILDGVYTRATSVFTGGEELGELLVLLFPFALYKLFVSKNKLYFILTAALLLGVLISGTRSAFLLIIFQILVFVYILAPPKYRTRKAIITFGFVIISILMLPLVFQYAHVLFDRVNATIHAFKFEGDFLTFANRHDVWPPAYELTKNTISFFGHGPIQAHRIGFPVANFHNLYLSLLFQFGIIGTVTFIIFFFHLIHRLVIACKNISRQNPVYLLCITCLLSLFCFLVNEIKYEFNRSDSYQQFVWIFFAVFYLTGCLLYSQKR